MFVHPLYTESGIHLSPEQWSIQLYGNGEKRSEMQSILDKLANAESFGKLVCELSVLLRRPTDDHQPDLLSTVAHFQFVSNISAESSHFGDFLFYLYY